MDVLQRWHATVVAAVAAEDMVVAVAIVAVAVVVVVSLLPTLHLSAGPDGNTIDSVAQDDSFDTDDRLMSSHRKTGLACSLMVTMA
jgi:hypothetical protein